MDGLSAFFILALSVLVICVSLYSVGYLSHYCGKRPLGLFHFLYAMFIISMMLVLTSSNTVFFYMTWEVMSLVSYFLVIFESEKEENRKAGTLYIVMTHVATAFLLAGFMIIYSYTGSFDIFGSSDAIPETAKNIIFIFFLVGFGTKAGVIPVHIWLPYAHPAAPSNISALMSGIMIKTAIYGLVRFVIGFLGVTHVLVGVLVLSIGIVSTVLGVAYALMEHNIKRLLAFHSVENIGIILIGIGVSMTATANGNIFIAALALVAALFSYIQPRFIQRRAVPWRRLDTVLLSYKGYRGTGRPDQKKCLLPHCLYCAFRLRSQQSFHTTALSVNGSHSSRCLPASRRVRQR